MPETSLTVVTTAGYGEGIADIGYEAADQANGNDFVNTGAERLTINNASGGNVTCTVTVPASGETFNEAGTKAITVAAAGTGSLGPFPPRIYGSPVVISWDVDTSITIATVRESPTQ